MIETIQQNIKRAWSRVLEWSNVLSERVRVELAVIGIIKDIKKIEERIEENYKVIGKRLFELRERQEKNVLKDEEIIKCLTEIQRLIQEKDGLLKKASEITEIGTRSPDIKIK